MVIERFKTVMDTSILLRYLIGLLPILAATYILYITWLRSKYPPGPYPLPIIGNMHLLSKKLQLDLARLAKRYGPVYTLWLGAEPTVIVCDIELVKEAAVQKGLEFAGKAMSSNGYKVCFTENEDLLTRSYDSKVEMMRKLSLSIMNMKAIGGLSIQKVIEEEMLLLLQAVSKLSGEAVDLKMVINVPVSNTIMRSLLNFRFHSLDDPQFKRWIEVTKAMEVAVEYSVFVNIVPALWYLLPWVRKTVYYGSQEFHNFMESYFKQNEETYQDGEIRDFSDVLIRYLKEQGSDHHPSDTLTRQNALELLLNLIGGGTQTTMSSICWCCLVLLYRRDILEKIQQELDQYVTRNKLDQEPNSKNGRDEGSDKKEGPHKLMFHVSDRPNLPYLNAVIHESFRRCSVSAMLSPHKTLVDTSVGGYSLAKGTAVNFNVHACHMDEKVWKNPFDFVPERFLDNDGSFDYSKAKLLLLFGAGPRSCVGEKLARVAIFTCLANVLYMFDLSCPSVDKLPSIDDGIYHLTYDPRDFDVIFTPRSAMKAPSSN